MLGYYICASAGIIQLGFFSGYFSGSWVVFCYNPFGLVRRVGSYVYLDTPPTSPRAILWSSVFLLLHLGQKSSKRFVCIHVWAYLSEYFAYTLPAQASFSFGSKEETSIMGISEFPRQMITGVRRRWSHEWNNSLHANCDTASLTARKIPSNMCKTRRYTRKVDSVVFPKVLVLRPLVLDRRSFHMIYLKDPARAIRRWLTGSIPDKSLCISHYNGACLSPCLWPRSQTGSPRALWTTEGSGPS